MDIDELRWDKRLLMARANYTHLSAETKSTLVGIQPAAATSKRRETRRAQTTLTTARADDNWRAARRH